MTANRNKTLRDRLEAAVRAGDHPSPLAKLLGFRLISMEPGRAVVEMEAGDHHANPLGTVHGGVLCTIADSSMGIAQGILLGEGESATTIELKINFLRPVSSGKLRAVGKVVKRGKTLTLLESDVSDEAGNLVARASSTYMTLRGEQPKAPL